MPVYGWAGPGKIEELTHDRATAPELEVPTSPDLDGPADDHTKLFRCTVPGCGKKFRKAMIVARHFNSNHDTLRQDADTWREFSEEVWE